MHRGIKSCLVEKTEGLQEGTAYLTVLTREFLLEDVLSEQGQPRIDNNPVNSKTYNVSFHNKKQEYLHQKQEIIIARSGKYGEHQVSHQWEKVQQMWN